MRVYDVIPGIPAAGHLSGGYYHPGNKLNCARPGCNMSQDERRKEGDREHGRK